MNAAEKKLKYPAPTGERGRRGVKKTGNGAYGG